MGGRTLKVTSKRVPASKRWMGGRSPIPPKISMRVIDAAAGVERKYFDLEVSAFLSANTTWTPGTNGAWATSEPAITIGDDVYQRNGRKIMLTRVHFKGNVLTTQVTAQTAVPAPITARIILYHQYSGSAGGSVLGKADNTAFANAANALGAMASPQIFGSGKVVGDQTVHLNPCAAANNAAATTVSAVAEEQTIELDYRPKKPIEIYYQPASTSPNKTFWLLGLCDATTGYAPSINGVCRFYYTDA